MYTDFFKLAKKPFQLTPSPRVFYPGPEVKHCYDKLLKGIKAGQILSLITGEPGTGKTLFAQKLQVDLQDDRSCHCINLPLTTLTLDEILEYICVELELNYGLGQNENALDIIDTFLTHGVSPIEAVVIIIDDAQNLTVDMINGLTMLIYLGANAKRIVQIVLLARNKEWMQFDRPELASFKEKISLYCQIQPLSADQVADYIKYQLEEARAANTKLFTAGACAHIFQHTNGYARAINVLCDQVLIRAANDGVNVITPELVDAVHQKSESQDAIERHSSQVSDAVTHYVNYQSESPQSLSELVDAVHQKSESQDTIERHSSQVSDAVAHYANYQSETPQSLFESDDERIQDSAPSIKQCTIDEMPRNNADPMASRAHAGVRNPSVNNLSKRRGWGQVIALLMVLSILGLLYSQLQSKNEIIKDLKRLVDLNNKPARGNDPVMKDLLNHLPISLTEEQPVVEEPQVDQVTIEELFREANKQISNNQLTEPKGDNALETYQHILVRDQKNLQAQEGIASLKEDFIRWAKNSEKNKELERALSQYDKALQIDQDDQELSEKIAKLREWISTGNSDETLTIVLEYARTGNTKDLAELLEKGAFSDVRDKSGSTALMLAAANGHLSAVKVLLTYKADVNLANEIGDTALMYAVPGNHQAIAKLLIANQAKVNATNKQDWTALMYATIHGHASLLTLLREAGATLEQRTKDGKTPLVAAIHTGQDEIVKLLLNHGARIDTRDNEDRTPLMLAAWYGFDTIVEILLEYGADKSVSNSNGVKAIDLARQQQHENIVVLLGLTSPQKVEPPY